SLAVRVKQPESAAKQRGELEGRRRELEKKLAPRGGAASKLADPWVELAEARRKLGKDSILIDIARFPVYHFDGKGGQDRWDAARYVAWIIPATGAGEIYMVDL